MPVLREHISPRIATLKRILLALLVSVFMAGAAHGQIPSVTGVSPNFGAAGTLVTVTGTNFGASQGSNSLTFCGLAATSIISWSETSVSGIVPSSPTWPTISCDVVVRANGVSSGCCTTSTVFDYSPPVITSTPAYGAIGNSVTISGVNFWIYSRNSHLQWRTGRPGNPLEHRLCRVCAGRGNLGQHRGHVISRRRQQWNAVYRYPPHGLLFDSRRLHNARATAVENLENAIRHHELCFVRSGQPACRRLSGSGL
jgi:IPT/TIG domain-containing protein